jgi:hypothetical protein
MARELAPSVAIHPTTAHLAPLPQLDPLPKPEPETRWEGRMCGETGPAAGADFHVSFVMALAGQVIAGSGCSSDFPRNAEPASRTFSLTGVRRGASVSLEFWFDHSVIGRGGFMIDAAFTSVEEDRLEGRWTYRCGPSCGCGGSSGRFEAEKVVED